MSYIINVEVDKKDLVEIVDIINKHDIDTSVGDVVLSVEEVENNFKLLSYLLTSHIESGYDGFECWNSDGFCEFEDYR